MFRVFTTKEFNKRLSCLDESDKKKVHKIMRQLKEKGCLLGKPLGRNYFREKKFGGKRLYFLVYKKFMVILGVGIGNKKTQQETIDNILRKIKEHERFVKNKFN